MAGFVASIFCRGIPFVQIPTTIVAQVDSSVGGKTGVNVPEGKNLIGTFQQPRLVLVDPDVLVTLPDQVFHEGFAEVIKHAAIRDAGMLEKIEAMDPDDRKVDPDLIADNLAIKARIVEEDERETSGTRALLNFGHTFGHALEAETGFSDKLLHGEAVALGMVLAARFSARRELISLTDAERVADALARAGLPTEIAALGMDCDGTTLAHHMRNDKKAEANTVPFILLRSVGEAYVARDVDLADVAAFMDEQLRAH